MKIFVFFQRTVSLAYAGLKSDHMHRYEQSKYLANSLKTDIVDEISEFNKKQTNEMKALQTNFKKLEKDLRNSFSKTEDVSFSNNIFFLYSTIHFFPLKIYSE